MLDKGDFKEEDEAGAKHPAKYVALHGTGTTVENPLQSTETQLDTLSFRQSKTWFRFYPVLPLLYVGHVWFRRRVLPWPPATSLKMWELYTSAGIYALLETERRRMQTHWVDNRDLGIIQLGAFFLWRDNHHRLAEIKATQFEKSVPGYLAWYPRRRDGILAQFSWWNDHMWSSEQTWKGVLVVLFNTTATQIADRDIGKYLQGKDWDKTATFFANSIHSPDGMRNKNLAVPVATTFAGVTSLTMMARWLRWRNPILWLNAAQRLLFYGVAYLWPMHTYHYYWYSNTIEDKRKVARIVCEMYPGVDDLIDKLIRDFREEILEATYNIKKW